MHAHHRLIRALVAELREARRQIAAAYEVQELMEEAAARRQRAQSEELERRRRDAEWEDDQRQRALRDLERARSDGNEYGMEDALRRLRR